MELNVYRLGRSDLNVQRFGRMDLDVEKDERKESRIILQKY
jgi:hypothetical protein